MVSVEDASEILSSMVEATFDELDESLPPDIVRTLVKEALSGDLRHPLESTAAQGQLGHETIATITSVIMALAAIIQTAGTLDLLGGDQEVDLPQMIIIVESRIRDDPEGVKKDLIAHGCKRPQEVLDAMTDALKSKTARSPKDN